MAQITLFEDWGFRVNKRELLLILKALGGRLKPDETEEAARLGDCLTHNKVEELQSVTDRLRAALSMGSSL